MNAKSPATIAHYIDEAPADGRPLLHELHALLKSVAPHADAVIKWGTPFFVEPRFVFAFSAHKGHASFAPTATVMETFRNELADHQATKGLVKLPYDQPLPEALIRRMATACVKEVSEREGDSFWGAAR